MDGNARYRLGIASAYNKVVVNLSDAGGYNTSFPLWSMPPQIESHETIVVAHVNGNHYIRVALREGFPLPLTRPLWITYRSDVASGWEDKFIRRQNEFREYYYRSFKGTLCESEDTQTQANDSLINEAMCMGTYSTSSNLIPPSTNPESVIRNRRRNLGDLSLLLNFEEIYMDNDPNNVQGPSPVGPNFQYPNPDLRPMEELLQAPIYGVGDAIVVPPFLLINSN
nr:hypothetical protein [Tanacetum cinerariifolium]